VPRASLDFIDWMKAIGISLIVLGHVAASFTDGLTPPIYPKQLGVAFFLFAMGFSLAREGRPRWEVVRNRLFEVYFFGFVCAVLLSVIAYVAHGALYGSNYLPFLGGVNVVFNNFPVNPTTWYIGTYLHFLLLWALVLRHVRMTPRLLAISIASEIAVRATLVATLGTFVAYMMVPNWISVFLFGMWSGQQPEPRRHDDAPRLALALAALVTLVVVWALLVPPFVAERTFPFMRIGRGPAALAGVLTSACVSFLYLSYTWLVFQATSRVNAPAVIRFVARNTVLVFIVHMPVFYALEPYLQAWATGPLMNVAIRLAVCLVALAIASEMIRRVIRPKELRDRIFASTQRPPAVRAERMGAL
jgi:fucose 4-O-acetylase-like acetyltransferase